MATLETAEFQQLPIEGFEAAYVQNPNNADPKWLYRVFCVALARGLEVRINYLKSIPNRTFGEQQRLSWATQDYNALIAEAVDGSSQFVVEPVSYDGEIKE